MTNEGEIIAKLDDSFSSSEMIIPTISCKQTDFSKIKSSLSKIISGRINGLDLIRIDSVNESLMVPKFDYLIEKKCIKGNLILKGEPRLVRIIVSVVDKEGGIGLFNKVIPIKKAFDINVKHPSFFRLNSIVDCKLKIYNNSNTYFQVIIMDEKKEVTVYSGEKHKQYFQVNDNEIPYKVFVKNIPNPRLKFAEAIKGLNPWLKIVYLMQ